MTYFISLKNINYKSLNLFIILIIVITLFINIFNFINLNARNLIIIDNTGEYCENNQTQIQQDTCDTVCEPIENNTCNIAKNNTADIPVYFYYGNTTNAYTIFNAISYLQIDGNSLEIDTNKIFDYYNTTGDNSTPESIQCNNITNTNFSNIKYQINPNIVSSDKRNFKYALQSANNLQSVSGSSNGNLKAKHSGCIYLNLKVSADAVVGEEVVVSFDQDYGLDGNGANNSLDGQQAGTDRYYTEEERPAVQKFIFKIANNTSSLPSSSRQPSSSSSSSTSSPITPSTTTPTGGPTYLAIATIIVFSIILYISSSSSKRKID